MDCDARQEQLSQLLDGEGCAREQADLFAHLGACADCRDWFDALARMRRSLREDHEAIAAAADDIPLPVPGHEESPRAPARAFRGSGHAWRVPWPLAATLALVLLGAGALLGARSPLAGGLRGMAEGRAPVVVICSLPEVTVLPQGAVR